ncbi:MAG: C-type lectin domain-containing protein [Deltaproteobacteria bacterium]|nr:C-type lectin domain-containing protein [Deltaproteobacteria bacterium]
MGRRVRAWDCWKWVVLWVLVAACDGTPPAPLIDFSDYRYNAWDWMEGAGGDGLPPADLCPDCPLPDGGREGGGGDLADGSGPEADSAIDIPGVDEIDTGLCSPKTIFCHENSRAQCNVAGDDFVVLDECSDDDPCTLDQCINGMCVFPRDDKVSCCFPPCEFGQLCVNSKCVCAPKCFGKVCGDDGCGGSCGECGEGFSCSPKGACECVPVCEGKQCGPDECGGDCGYCVLPATCQPDGQCACIPSCAGKQCGNDGCGGSCGGCPALHQCQPDGLCVYSCPVCPTLSGCQALPFNGHVYYFCNANRTWGDARNWCKDQGTHLASISSAEEQAFLAAHLGGVSNWIGLYQEWYTWEWSWANGEPVKFTAWAGGQPDDGDFWTTEDCVEMFAWGPWNDNDCGAKRRYICEFEPAS